MNSQAGRSDPGSNMLKQLTIVLPASLEADSPRPSAAASVTKTAFGCSLTTPQVSSVTPSPLIETPAGGTSPSKPGNRTAA